MAILPTERRNSPGIANKYDRVKPRFLALQLSVPLNFLAQQFTQNKRFTQRIRP